MAKQPKIYRCPICGAIVDEFDDDAQIPVCCNQEMQLLTANTTDGAGEKHVPVVHRADDGVTVTVGEVPHPMKQEHYIEWIAIMTGNTVQRTFLKPGNPPAVTFSADNADVEIVAYEYCNLHGLWRS